MAEEKKLMRNRIIYYSVLIALLVSCGGEELKLSYPEYYRGSNEIFTLIKNDELEKAIIIFDSLSTGIPHVPSSSYFGIARACAEKGKCDLAAKYLEKSLINGQEYGKGIGKYKTIEQCKEVINRVLIKESEIHRERFIYEYKELVDSMLVNDQKVRSELDTNKRRIVDSFNMETLLLNIKKYGYPSEKLVGHKSAFNAFILMLHFDRDKNNEIFGPILNEAYNSGELSPNGFAWIIDRRREFGDDQLEPYYYQLPYKKYENINLQLINRRRDSIGLYPK